MPCTRYTVYEATPLGSALSTAAGTTNGPGAYGLSVTRATYGSVPVVRFRNESGRASSAAEYALGSAVGLPGIGAVSVTITSRRAQSTVAPGICGPKSTPTSPNGLCTVGDVQTFRVTFGPRIDSNWLAG